MDIIIAFVWTWVESKNVTGMNTILLISMGEAYDAITNILLFYK